MLEWWCCSIRRWWEMLRWPLPIWPCGAKSHWRNLARAITFQWIPIGGLFAPKGDMFAPFDATWRTLGADCSMQVARRNIQTFWNFLAATFKFGAVTGHHEPVGRQFEPLNATRHLIGDTRRQAENCIGANWHQLALAQWTPSITCRRIDS